MRSSPEAAAASDAARDYSFVRKLLPCFLLCAVCFFFLTSAPNSALGQQSELTQPQASAPAAPTESKPTESKPSEIKENSTELATHDEPTTFKVNVRLVLVRTVVRDAQGHAIGNLTKDDFQVLDKGKPQVISQFEVEQPGTLAAKARQSSAENNGDASFENTNSADVPERFIAYLFDDVHLEFGDLARVRQAAERHFATLKPTDRAAIFTTSGQTMLSYTDDRVKLHETLSRLMPRPITSGFNGDCLQISYYQADLIVNKNDPQATQVALQEEIACSPVPPGMPQPNPMPIVQTTANSVLAGGDHESRISLELLKGVVRNLSMMPGQRSVVLISPGFIAPQMEYDYTEIIDRAVRSQVIINALDARGLFVVMPGGDISRSTDHLPPPQKALIETAAASAQEDLLAVFAEGTGGVFFHNNNDFDDGLRRVAETPEYSYVLAFVPQNLKLDGSYHNLKVTVKSGQKLSVQARRGYYAPKNSLDPAQEAKQEIQEATFSQEELHTLPVKLHTQFFKASDDDAKLVVLAHVDVKLLHFKKVEGRNYDVLTCVSALFNRNGSFLQGTEKTVTMQLKDDTLEHKLSSGITLKTSFDVKPGSYMVRLVVRDAEGQLSAENGTVEIR